MVGLKRNVFRLLAIPLSICTFALATGPAQGAQLGPAGLVPAAANYLLSPGAVSGANDWRCRPGGAHPTPVILLHGTLVNTGANWVAISPILKSTGYCVYALNYGMTALSLGDRIGGLGDIATSAQRLSSFVDKVRAQTGASKVDIVGHSQGGMMPNYYLKRLGGASKVRTLVGIAPSNHGIAPYGFLHLADSLGFLGSLVRPAIDAAVRANVPGMLQQENGSSFQRALFADGDTVPGPRYAVIETNKDTTVSPYTNAFLSGPKVTNILIQDQCPDDEVAHIGLFLDWPAIQNVLNQLGPNDPGFRAECSAYGPAL